MNYCIDLYRNGKKQDWFDPHDDAPTPEIRLKNDIGPYYAKEGDSIVVKTFTYWKKADFINGKFTNWETIIEDTEDFEVLNQIAEGIKNLNLEELT